MDKQNVVYTGNWILFSLKKEGNSDIWCNMDETWGHYAKWNKPVTKRQILFDSHELSRVIQFIETESTMVVAGGWGRGNWEVVLSWVESVLQDEKSSGDWLYNNVNIVNTTKLNSLKWLRW